MLILRAIPLRGLDPAGIGRCENGERSALPVPRTMRCGGMRTRVKVCCIATQEEARIAIEAGADALGFVSVQPPNSRTIPEHMISEIVADIPPVVASVVLTTEKAAEGISAHIQRTRPTAVQILNHIAPEELAQLARLEPGIRRVQVIHVERPEALDLIPAYAPHVHAFLLDSGKPNLRTPVFGGTGHTHDWNISAAFVEASPRPVMLAGGLTAANAAEAIRRVRPFGLDLCTGVRTEGHLDAVKLANFMSAVRQADEMAGVA